MTPTPPAPPATGPTLGPPAGGPAPKSRIREAKPPRPIPRLPPESLSVAEAGKPPRDSWRAWWERSLPMEAALHLAGGVARCLGLFTPPLEVPWNLKPLPRRRAENGERVLPGPVLAP